MLFKLKNPILLCFILLSNIYNLSALGYFDGPYANLGFGLREDIYKNDPNLLVDVGAGAIQIAIENDSISRDDAVQAALTLGWSNVSQAKFYYAGEANLRLQKATDAMAHTSVMSTAGGMTTTQIHPHLTVENLNFSTSLIAKLGILPFPHTVFYGLVGPEFSRFKSTAMSSFNADFGGGTITGMSRKSKSEWKPGIVMGAGAESYFSSNFSYGVKFTHSIYNKLPSPGLNTQLTGAITGEFITRNKVSAHMNSVMVYGSYHFAVF